MKYHNQLQKIGFVLILIISSQSCISTRIVSEYDNNSIVKYSTTSWSYAWGLVTPKDIDPKCESKHMNSVTSSTNLGYILLSAITIGIVVPQTIEWECTPVDPCIENL